MHNANLLTGLDTGILMVPFFGLLVFSMFGLDERVVAPRGRSTRRRFCQTDGHGASFLCDPDGRPYKVRGPVTPPPPMVERMAENRSREGRP